MASEEAPQVELDESEELADLESEVRQMSDKIYRYRTTLQEKLKNSFASLLVAHRPVVPEPLDPWTSRDTCTDTTEGDKETREKLRLLKEKISSNASAMPAVLKRMRECVSRIDKLDSRSQTIHPAFKRKRIS